MDIAVHRIKTIEIMKIAHFQKTDSYVLNINIANDTENACISLFSNDPKVFKEIQTEIEEVEEDK